MSQDVHQDIAAIDSADIDVSQRLDDLERQLEQLIDQLKRAQRLAAVGTMATMIAHEFNNILTPIISYSQYALHKGDEELMRKALEKVLTNGERASGICTRIMGFAAGGNSGSTCSVADVVDESVACLVRDPEKDNINLRSQIDPDLAVRINADELQQVLYNLLINARQAMLQADRQGILRITGRRRDDVVEITVQDNGSGIASDDIAHIFEPFFSTKRHNDKPDRKGIGLGLCVCRQIIEDAGGTIDVESTLGKGTTFTIVLPVAG